MLEKTEAAGIKNWAEDDRPREKLDSKGKSALSMSELIAIIIGSGTKTESAVAVSKNILRSVNDNLPELSRLSVEDLMKFRGIGKAKAISIVAALELGARRQLSEVLTRKKIIQSRDVFDLFHPTLAALNYEEFWIILVNRANKIIEKKRISTGGVSGTVADPRIIFKMAIESLASGIILCHNHPSGNLNPSEADIQLTKKLKEGGKYLDVQVLDHIIITESGFYSFADEGIM
jgi:DNA repair protein RadC